MKFAFIKSATLATAIAMSFSGCNLIGDGVCVSPSGTVLSETVVLEEFTSIDVVDVAKVFLSEGTSQEITVDAEQEVLDRMDIQVVNGELRIKLDGCFQDDFTFDVFVTIPSDRSLEKVQVDGAGDLVTRSPIGVADDFDLGLSGASDVFFESKNENESFDLNISGAGGAEVVARSKNMSVTISGAGDADVMGVTSTLTATVSGAGNLGAFDLDAESARLDINGSGDAEVTITGEDLEVDISGSGSVYYKGTPVNIQSRISGAGELVNAN